MASPRTLKLMRERRAQQQQDQQASQIKRESNRRPIEIDPSNMTDTSSELLSKFLTSRPPSEETNRFFPEEKTFSFSDSDPSLASIPMSIRLTQPIFWRACNPDGKHKDKFRYVVFSGTTKPLAKTGKTIVYDELCTLVPDKEKGFIVKQHKTSRIVKLKTMFSREEYTLSQQASHLHVHPPTSVVMDTDKAICFFSVEKKMDGKPLSEFEYDLMTTNERLILMRILAARLKEQLHDKEIVHRDVKPENVIVKRSKFIFDVNYIDLDLAKESKRSDVDEHVGTLEYASLEVFMGTGTDYRSDVASLGIMFFGLLGAERNNPLPYPSWESQTQLKENIRIARGNAENIPESFMNLFSGLDELSEKHKGVLKDLLGEMTQRIKENRCSLDHVIEVLGKICKEFQEQEEQKYQDTLDQEPTLSLTSLRIS